MGSSTSRAHTASGTSSWGESHVAVVKQMLDDRCPCAWSKEGAGFDIHIVSLAEDEEQRP